MEKQSDSQILSWLESETGQDAQIARSLNITQIPERIVEGVRVLVRQHDANALAIVTGGMMTPTIDFQRLRRRLPPENQCPYCNSQVIPTVDHILWHCSHFSHLRQITTAPICPLVRRIRWSHTQAPNQTLIRQMAAVRSAETKLRLRPQTLRSRVFRFGAALHGLQEHAAR